MEKEGALGRSIKHPRCPYCHEGVAPEQKKQACDACMAWHHSECWREHGGCSACGSEARVGEAELQDDAGAAGALSEDESEEGSAAHWSPSPEMLASAYLLSDRNRDQSVGRTGHAIGAIASLVLALGLLGGATAIATSGMNSAEVPVFLFLLILGLGFGFWGSRALLRFRKARLRLRAHRRS